MTAEPIFCCFICHIDINSTKLTMSDKNEKISNGDEEDLKDLLISWKCAHLLSKLKGTLCLTLSLNNVQSTFVLYTFFRRKYFS